MLVTMVFRVCFVTTRILFLLAKAGVVHLRSGQAPSPLLFIKSPRCQ